MSKEDGKTCAACGRASSHLRRRDNITEAMLCDYCWFGDGDE